MNHVAVGMIMRNFIFLVCDGFECGVAVLRLLGLHGSVNGVDGEEGCTLLNREFSTDG